MNETVDCVIVGVVPCLVILPLPFDEGELKTLEDLANRLVRSLRYETPLLCSYWVTEIDGGEEVQELRVAEVAVDLVTEMYSAELSSPIIYNSTKKLP